MKDGDFAKELIDILDQSMNLIRQEIVTLRNDVMQQKIEINELSNVIRSFREDKKSKWALITVVAGGIVAGVSAVVVEIVKLIKSH